MNFWDTKRDGVRIRILETGEEFNSITACANYLGVNPRWLGKVARGNDNLCTCHGYHLIRVDDPRLNYDIYKKIIPNSKFKNNYEIKQYLKNFYKKYTL